MRKTAIFILKVFRKLYGKLFRVKPLPKPESEEDSDKAAQIIYDELRSDQPSMIARFGAFELSVIVNYLGVKQQNGNIWKYIKGESLPWWWNQKTLYHMQNNAGFFPPTKEKIQQFGELMLQDMQEVDVLGSWMPEEFYFQDKISKAQKIKLVLLEPYTSKTPWSRALKGKKVLVVHPFAELIEEQYKKRAFLFDNPAVLPEFELQTLQAVQSIGGETNGFTDWFEALEWMKDEVDKRAYDVCLIGAGAYGFPLAAHIKRQGKKAVHLGGALQLLFGIKGKRWENPNYGVMEWGIPKGYYVELKNKYWVRPMHKEKPKTAAEVEDACYW